MNSDEQTAPGLHAPGPEATAVTYAMGAQGGDRDRRYDDGSGERGRIRTQGVVLIVDDQPVMRALIRDFLQSAFTGLDLREAPDADRALALVREHSPLAVLTDINLPGMSGLELTPRIHALSPAARVIVVTHHDGPAYRESAEAAGAFGYVHKDMIFVELAPLLIRALRAREENTPRGEA